MVAAIADLRQSVAAVISQRNGIQRMQRKIAAAENTSDLIRSMHIAGRVRILYVADSWGG